MTVGHVPEALRAVSRGRGNGHSKVPLDIP
jgi:hypothetical protein